MIAILSSIRTYLSKCVDIATFKQQRRSIFVDQCGTNGQQAEMLAEAQEFLFTFISALTTTNNNVNQPFDTTRHRQRRPIVFKPEFAHQLMEWAKSLRFSHTILPTLLLPLVEQLSSNHENWNTMQTLISNLYRHHRKKPNAAIQSKILSWLTSIATFRIEGTGDQDDLQAAHSRDLPNVGALTALRVWSVRVLGAIHDSTGNVRWNLSASGCPLS